MDVTSRSLRKFHPAKPARVGTEAPTVEVCRTVPTLVASDPRAEKVGQALHVGIPTRTGYGAQFTKEVADARGRRLDDRRLLKGAASEHLNERR